MLSPKRVRWRKPQKGNLKGTPSKGTEIAFGTYGMIALQPERISARQLEAARIALTRSIRRSGKVWIRVFPQKAETSKPAEVRMGKGKGPPERWVAPVRPGRLIFEVDGVPEESAREAFRLAGHKLPLKTKFVERGGPL